MTSHPQRYCNFKDLTRTPSYQSHQHNPTIGDAGFGQMLLPGFAFAVARWLQCIAGSRFVPVVVFVPMASQCKFRNAGMTGAKLTFHPVSAAKSRYPGAYHHLPGI